MPTATISDTFATYNVVVTIYVAGPLSVLFLLRIYNTLRCAESELDNRSKKIVCICLLLSQYTLSVVIRFDAIKGGVHAAATMLTFALLLAYHVMTRHSARTQAHELFGIPLKTLLGSASVACILLFGMMVLLVQHPLEHTELWTMAVVFEIAGVLFLGSMDMLDIQDLGIDLETLDDRHDDTGGRDPTYENRHANFIS
jgi:hypothetical protein